MDNKSLKNRLVSAVSKWWPLVVIFGIVVCGFSMIDSQRRENDELRATLHASRDTLRTTITRNGDLMASVTAYVSELKELKKYSAELQRQVDDYKKTTGVKPVTAVTAALETELPGADTVYVVEVGPDIDIKERFDFSDSWRTLTGSVAVNDSSLAVILDPMTVRARLKAGLDETGRVFVKTDNPYINIDSVEGFTAPKPKARRWGLSVQAGVGFDPSRVSIAPYVGIGISYNILTF